MKLIYNIFIFLYNAAVNVLSLFNSKAKLWVDGRKKIFTSLENLNLRNEKIIWIHCASLGEFEQGRPIIEKLKTSYPDYKILLTFFSPSGYEVRSNYEFADFIYYLPIDTKKNARRFVELVNPKLAIFVKYEFWFNYINELSVRKIPLIFVSVIFRPEQYFFHWWGSWFAHQLNKVTFLLVQNKQSINLLDNIKIYHSEVSGDTRFDRVAQLPNDNVSFPIIENFKGNAKLLIAGSTWPQGEKILLDLLHKSDKDFKLVIAPHLINNEHINDILKRFNVFKPILYSKHSSSGLAESRVLIIDSIGLLSHMYRYASIAYVGGGFGVGIHNLLEASTYSIPVIFGPNHQRFNEAIDLISNEGGFTISDSTGMLNIFNELNNNKQFYEKCCKAAKSYVSSNSGATNIVFNKLMEFL